MKHERLKQGILGGASLSDFSSMFPAATTGMCVMYRGLAGWVADFVASTDVSDIDLTSVAARSLLIYDVGTTTWIAGYISMDDLQDIDLTGIAKNAMLRYDGINSWVIIPPPSYSGMVLTSIGGVLAWQNPTLILPGFPIRITAEYWEEYTFSTVVTPSLPSSHVYLEGYVLSMVVV
jgi:hypothetical protein